MFDDLAASMASIDAEAANIAVALRLALAAGPIEPAARIVGSLGYYWFTSRRGDGAAWAEPVVAAATDVPDRVRARLLLGAGTVHADDPELGLAVRWLEEAAARYGELGNPGGVGWSLFWLGRSYAHVGRKLEAKRCFDDALPVFRQLGNVLGTGWCLSWLGGFAGEHGPEAAMPYEEEVLRLGQEHGVPHIVGNSLRAMSLLLWQQGRPDEAVTLAEDAVATYRELGDRWQLMNALQALALIRADLDPAAAAQPAAEALGLALTIRSMRDMRWSCAVAGAVERALGRPHEAAVLMAAADLADLATSSGPAVAGELVADAEWLSDPALADSVAEGRRLSVLVAAERARTGLLEAGGRSA